MPASRDLRFALNLHALGTLTTAVAHLAQQLGTKLVTEGPLHESLHDLDQGLDDLYRGVQQQLDEVRQSLTAGERAQVPPLP